ncbi:unnamed protein product [Euphydryas editha]|uniref:1-phosphatidylinositol-3-phosphate 5-kinase n=1 Tax=Euphydryas editha TaxID=104508 RepID=A0AAU9TUE9_EUPED|nr:unnamed protein product [Euphydryas editha]
MEKYDTTQLTEFPRFESESNQSGVTTFLNKLWKFPIFTPSESADSQDNKTPNEDRQGEPNDVNEDKEYDDVKTETGNYVVEYEGRSLPNILKRISGLAALGSGGGTKYEDTELARYWMPDDISRECYECAARFSALRRRHHCRVCGQIFCSRCCSQRVPGQIFGCAGGLRVCTYCCKVVLTYLRENDMNGDISPDLRTLQESLQVKFPDSKAQHKSRDFIFARDQEQCEVRSSTKESMHDIFRQLYYALPTQQHRAQATILCQGLLNNGYMERMTEPPQFADYALYRPVQLPDSEPAEPAPADHLAEDCSSRIVESVSSYCLDLNLGDSSARLIKATKTEQKSTPSSDDEQPILDQNENGGGSTACRAIVESGEEHLKLLMRQWLARDGLPAAWLPALYPLCVHAAELAMPDLFGSDIDVRNYVQVKKVPGGSMTDSCVIPGVVMTKNVAHRGMPKQISNPSVLLLDCSIAYQRVEGKLTSLEPLLMQEQEYLVRCAARITALRPHVVLVRGGAARAVQDALRLARVALAVGVRERALARAARCTRAERLASVDARIGTPRLGACRNFYVKNFSSKTLMVLEGCAEPQLGCCILLRGGSLPELIRLKKVVKFMLLACYNWKLEKAFLGDIEAVLPEPGTFVDDDDEPTDNVDEALKRELHTKDENDDGKSSNDTSENDDNIFGNTQPESLNDTQATENIVESSNDEIIECHDNSDPVTESNEKKGTVDVDKSEIDDPLQKTKQFARKTDSEKNLSCGVPIKDFSDPLQSRMSIDDDVFLPKEEAKLQADTHSERWCTDDVALSMSPNIVIPAPALRLLPPRAPHTPHCARAPAHPPRAPSPAARVALSMSPDIVIPAPALRLLPPRAPHTPHCARAPAHPPRAPSPAARVALSMSPDIVIPAPALRLLPPRAPHTPHCARAPAHPPRAPSPAARVALSMSPDIVIPAPALRLLPPRAPHTPHCARAPAHPPRAPSPAARVALSMSPDIVIPAPALRLLPPRAPHTPHCARAPAHPPRAPSPAARVALSMSPDIVIPAPALRLLPPRAPHTPHCARAPAHPPRAPSPAARVALSMSPDIVIPAPALRLLPPRAPHTPHCARAPAHPPRAPSPAARVALSMSPDIVIPAPALRLLPPRAPHTPHCARAPAHPPRAPSPAARVALSMSPDIVIPAPALRLLPPRAPHTPHCARAPAHPPRAPSPAARVALSMSPDIVIPAPALRLLPPRAPHTPHCARAPAHPPRAPSPAARENHPFIDRPITLPADDPAMRTSLAHFRATGCRLMADKHKPECPRYKPSVVKQVQTEESSKPTEPEPLDPLSPENHQRLSLLLYSYSNKSPNVPDFCVNPWIVTMEMYGRNDVSLGAFLEKYCFNSDYKCPSANCHIPMNQHVRKFVHEDVCITITCNTIGHSNVDKAKEEQNKQVMFWSRCETCGAVSRGSRLSRAALSLSLAQYVRTRLSAPRYARRQCAHALHRHSHAFVSRLTTACFRYNKITTYEVQLPPEVISINYDTRQMRDALIAQLNDLMLRGHETFSNATEPECEKAYAAFKQHMEQIHLALTTHDHASLAERVRKLWGVHDCVVVGEKMLRDAHRPRAADLVEEKPDQEDTTDTASNDVAENLLKDSEKEHTGTEEDEERGDKKTVKQILSQLLSNNQPSNQEVMVVTSGLVAVAVRAGDVGSVIAAALASPTYHKTLQQHRAAFLTSQSESEDGESSTAGKEKSETDKAKPKANEHIEVLLKEGLLCRVYYASQFHKLRHMLLAPLDYCEDNKQYWEEGKCCDDLNNKDKDNKGLCEIEEGFIRSLAHCVPWATRGGKSGSTFCKTKDDRYVLKEMTKPEWQQFLEFAPHYFNYVTNCHQKKLPSLLARILGVFSVGGAGSGVLVTEHVWYGSPVAQRFDLKGAARPRLPLAAQPPAAAVLLDEHLLRMRWERPLFVGGAGARALWAGAERDTRFLAAHGVMDYSLLLGVHAHVLVLGVIDYIRTFTWDKKLEHLVKKNLGHGQPTVVSPEQYRRRFCTACRKYFLHCPAHWEPLYAPDGL